MLTGDGANGKSTLIHWITALVGKSNVSSVTLQELSEHRFKVAEVYGKLVNAFADLDSRAIQSTSKFKAITSGDRMQGERKFGRIFDFCPFCKLVFSANEIPSAADTTHSYFRRWLIIDFPNRFNVGREADENLIDKLLTPAMLSGLLNVALAGLRRLADANGRFTESESIRGQLRDYRKSNDPVVSFIDDCIISSEGARVERRSVLTAFSQYCKDQGFRAVGRNRFYEKLRANGVRDSRIGNRDCFTDIRLSQYRGNEGIDES